MAEQVVQVNLDGVGKKIRTEEVTANAQLVQQQVVTLAKSDGTLLDTQLASLTNLDITVSAFRDAITAAGGAAKTLADVVTAISGTLKENLTQVAGVTLQTPALGVNTPPLLGTDVINNQVLGAQPIMGTVVVSNLARTVTGTVTAVQGTTPFVVDDSAVVQSLVDLNREMLQQLSTLTLMFAAVFSPNANLGGLMNTQLSPAVTN